jgi:hypothetical protein
VDLILQMLRQSIFGDILLVAVAGGVFAEGWTIPEKSSKPSPSSAPACRP